MSQVVLSIGANIGDRLACLQAVVDGLGPAVRAVSPVYETAAWGGVEQGAFFNAVVIADECGCDARDWLRRAQQLELDNARVRVQKWGPRTLDVDLVCCFDAGEEVFCDDANLTLPHPLAHLRAFVLIPWLAVDPGAELSVAGTPRPVQKLLADLNAAERDGVELTELSLTGPGAAGIGN